MQLTDIKTLKEVSMEYNILVVTLKKRLKYKKFDMVEGVDYKNLGARQPTLLSPGGVAKITRS